MPTEARLCLRERYLQCNDDAAMMMAVLDRVARPVKQLLNP